MEPVILVPLFLLSAGNSHIRDRSEYWNLSFLLSCSYFPQETVAIKTGQCGRACHSCSCFLLLTGKSLAVLKTDSEHWNLSFLYMCPYFPQVVAAVKTGLGSGICHSRSCFLLSAGNSGNNDGQMSETCQ